MLLYFLLYNVVAGLYQDFEAAMQFLFLHKSIDQRRLVVFGRSLGGAVATHLATVPMYAARISCVILENTFVDLPAIAACVFGVKALGRLPRWCYKNKVSGSDEYAIVRYNTSNCTIQYNTTSFISHIEQKYHSPHDNCC